MSEIRRKLLLYSYSGEESDVDYIKRQFLECQLLHPCSGYGVNRNNTLLLLRDTPQYGDYQPRRRAVFVIDKEKIRISSEWWGDAGLWHILPTANNYSMIHIPSSINKLTITHTNSLYLISAIIFNGLQKPKWDENVLSYASWYSANLVCTINLSNVYEDRWLWLHCHRSDDSYITYTSLEELKNSFNFQITVE